MHAPSPENTGFIPAREKPWFIALFSVYLRLLLFRRFGSVRISGAEHLDRAKPVLFYANHFYWWDALIPLYLSRSVLKLRPRAVMEDRQMVRFPFFSWIGAFSVNLSEKRALAATLRYAIAWLSEPGRCLFLFPNGAFTSPLAPLPPFKPGLDFLIRHSVAAVHPLAFYIDHTRGDKPDLHIRIGPDVRSISLDANGLDRCRSELSALLETAAHEAFNPAGDQATAR